VESRGGDEQEIAERGVEIRTDHQAGGGGEEDDVPRGHIALEIERALGQDEPGEKTGRAANRLPRAGSS
jgi:hypothetical protein